MNFNTVRQANEQNVTFNAVATNIEGTTFIPSGTPKQNCKFTDANGECQNVTIWQGNGQPIPLERQGQTLSINISFKQKGNRSSYGGFWNSQAQVAPLQGQPAPQQPQQAPPAATQSSNAPEPDWDAKDLRMARMAALKSSTQLLCLIAEMTNIEVSPNQIKKTASEFVEYIYKGIQPGDMLAQPKPEQVQPNPDYVGDEPAPSPKDDIPF